MKNRVVLLIVMLAALSYSHNCNANVEKSESKEDVKSTADSTQKEGKTAEYDKLFVKNESCISSTGEFITLHKTEGKVYFELPLKYIGREMLIATTISETSDNSMGTIGYKPTAPIHIKFVKIDARVFLSKVIVEPNYNKDNKPLSKAVELSTLAPILSSYKIECYNPDSTAVVLDMTDLFVGDSKILSPIGKGSGFIRTTGKHKKAGSILADIKSFDDNVSIKSYLSYDVTINILFLTLKKDEPVTMKVTRTVMLLPEEKMQARLADSRIGIFLTNMSKISNDEDQIRNYSVINRWNLEPSDIDAYKRKELVEPKESIVFYLDDAFPEKWRKPAKEGVLRWNSAFEKIGFKNSIIVKDYPKDDPNFDPDNLKYSCIRYVPSATTNAMGPSWVDPRSGEIINASVIIYNDVVKLINQWRFVQTAQIDKSVRGTLLPDDILHESIAYVIAHEVGHCLGFMHNMAASNAYPVDSLRSATFTQKYGTTASIMDYARFNYVAQPEDKGVRLTPPDIGIYDDYLIKYAYKPVLDKKGTFEELSTIRGWVDEKVDDPIFRYGRQQVSARLDPTAIEEDLGDDPIKAADYGIKNLKYILSNLDEWISVDDDAEGEYLEMTYKSILNQYNRYVQAVMMNIGGIYFTETNPGQGETASYAPVPKEIQRASLFWVLEQIQSCDWLADESITKQFSMQIDACAILKHDLTEDLLETYKNIVLSSHIATDDPYTLQEYFDDIFSVIWSKTLKGKPLNDTDILLQRLFVVESSSVVSKSPRISAGLTSIHEVYAPSIDEIKTFNLDHTGLINRYFDELKHIERVKGDEYTSNYIMNQLDYAYGYGWQKRISLSDIDNSQAIFYGEYQRILKLLKSKERRADKSTKRHYQSMIFIIEKDISVHNN